MPAINIPDPLPLAITLDRKVQPPFHSCRGEVHS